MKDILLKILDQFPLWGLLGIFTYHEFKTFQKLKKDNNNAHERLRKIGPKTKANESNIKAVQETLVKLHGKEGYIKLEKEEEEG